MKAKLSLLILLTVLVSCQSRQQNKSESSTISIKEARALPIGSEATIQGTITVASGAFSSSTPFGYALQDHTGGIYVIDSIPPMEGEFQLGEMVEVTGIIGETNMMLVLQESKASKKGEGNMIRAIDVQTGDVNQSTEGTVVHTSGIIDSLSSDIPYGYKIFINDGSGLLNIFINASTELISDTLQWRISDSISVTGFSAQYDAEYEVEPRIREDLQVFARNRN